MSRKIDKQINTINKSFVASLKNQKSIHFSQKKHKKRKRNENSETPNILAGYQKKKKKFA